MSESPEPLSQSALQPLLTAEQIDVAVERLADQIATDHGNVSLVVIGILKGAFMFLSDLVRRLPMPVDIDFLQVASYGEAASSSGVISLLKDIQMPIGDRHVLVIEDIVDTGVTLQYLLHRLSDHQPASLRSCCLLDKPAARRVPMQVDYVGFEIDDHFVVGYGMDLAERYRNLPNIYTVSTDESAPT